MLSDEGEDDRRGLRVWILFRECSERFFVWVADGQVEMVFQFFITSTLLKSFVFQQFHRNLLTPAAYKIIIFLCILLYVFLKNEKLFQQLQHNLGKIRVPIWGVDVDVEVLFAGRIMAGGLLIFSWYHAFLGSVRI